MKQLPSFVRPDRRLLVGKSDIRPVHPGGAVKLNRRALRRMLPAAPDQQGVELEVTTAQCRLRYATYLNQ